MPPIGNVWGESGPQYVAGIAPQLRLGSRHCMPSVGGGRQVRVPKANPVRRPVHPVRRPARHSVRNPHSSVTSRCAGPVAQWSEPTAHNGLVAGSKSCRAHHAFSRKRRFLNVHRKAPHWRACGPSVWSVQRPIRSQEGILGGLSLALGIPIPEKRRRLRQKLGPGRGS